MPEFHAEPFIHLAGLSSSSAIIAWGAFYFRVRSKGRWKLVDDRDLERDRPRQAARRGDVVREDGGPGRDEQDVVEGQPFLRELVPPIFQVHRC